MIPLPSFNHAMVGVCLCAAVCDGYAQDSSEEKAVRLPDMLVTELINRSLQETWSYTRIGHFEVLSGVPDHKARVVLREMDRFARILPLVWPAAADHATQVPTSIILCGPSNHLFAFLPTDGSMQDETSVIWRSSDRAALILNMDAILLPVMGEDEEVDLPDNFERQAAQLYVRLLLAGRDTSLPRWTEAGLIHVLSDIEIWGKWLTYGKVETEKNMPTGGQPLVRRRGDPCAPSGYAQLSFKQVFARADFLPFERLFTGLQENGQPPSLDSIWAKQAQAFVHFCLFGGKLRHRDALARFVDRLRHEPPSEILFKECFGTDYRGMEKQLRSYLAHTRHTYQRYAVPKGLLDSKSAIEFTAATAAQIGRLKGDASVLAGRTDFAMQTYTHAYDLDVRDPQMLASYGLALLSTGGLQQGEGLLLQAIASKVERPAAYVAQARIRLDAFRADPGPDGKLTQQQLAAVLSPLFQARKIPPALPELYETIADAWASSSVTPTLAHLAVLGEGVRQFPRDSVLLHQTAQLYHQIGSDETAAAIAKVGLRFSSDPETRARFEQLLASLPATAPTR